MMKNDYQIPMFRDEDFEEDPEEGRLAIVQLILSAINSYRLTQFGDFSPARNGIINAHQLQEFM
jgi:hypothetical protein